MKVIGKHILDQFKQTYPDAIKQTDVWINDVQMASWLMFADVKALYRTVDFVAPDNLIFNLKGNRYRIWVRINYRYQTIFIEKAGTHREYSHWSIN